MITKHQGTKGLVNVDNVICQFLYELQGPIYLNSDVTANAKDLQVEQVGKNRVRLSNVKGYPPPPTTKLAIFYRGGYESQILFNATGYGTKKKYELMQKQIRFGLKEKGLEDKFQLLDFQELGTPAPNPRSQFESTTYLRVFAQTDHEVSFFSACIKTKCSIICTLLTSYSGDLIWSLEDCLRIRHAALFRHASFP